ncbi:unnamed protein product [Brassica napus]|uniref:(rape) hypothetical protein n=1 Tax=Brassica napus TaxID=3708 RepID=A0A816X6G2_BRANA|nr:unnamed protein product [Brassica napus]
MDQHMHCKSPSYRALHQWRFLLFLSFYCPHVFDLG